MRVCERCGDPIVGWRRDARFCSTRCQQRSWDVGKCVHCGATTADRRHTRCWKCAVDQQNRRKSEERNARWERIAALYRQGVSLAGIAEVVGSTPNSVNVTLVSMRQAGYDLPYRRIPCWEAA